MEGGAWALNKCSSELLLTIPEVAEAAIGPPGDRGLDKMISGSPIGQLYSVGECGCIVLRGRGEGIWT
jgi:hypothetical protein